MMSELSWENRVAGLMQPDERLDDLQYGDLHILQKRDGFCFGTDAVLLANFARSRHTGRILDMGCGTGVIALLLSQRLPRSTLTALELQHDMADMAARSVAMNGLEGRVTVLEGDLRAHRSLFAPCSFDTVVMNPPYTPVGRGPENDAPDLAAARHEATCTVADMAEAAFYLLRNGGNLCVVYPADRIAELLAAVSAARLTPKRLRLVQHLVGKAPKLLLMEAVRQGKPGVEWLPTLILCEEDGSYTEEARKIYHMEA